ncbi:dTDP-glucose 4,6-dehydratase [Achromobacter ruhlandii]|uniref:dTDP-glucose 4,6-dehydratase n=1 Tax=Achromobacter ruhlandii TaxID=72557 RepID=UPI0006C1FC15|nr:dTDP-glucose 4,6-dehydratase [Achromobacter ruhlandii]AVC42552.1 dTDP-glucose 4,6-dehydratase [Achromobacter xylosoxidans]CUJ29857.1 dTDP-glucose 4%2C6-dehydratase [Achromobacter ruhlandii]CUJ63970.1 dTDP-glucose 4%2C6-dehydratase [Achromobacter ruhlandii]CUK23621.1 dTDP-glucose 4%2C6-dehydratase [Achromobacter ruhlandii]
MSILVTGGAGFIGSNFVLDWLAQGGEPVINLDKLTYAGNRHNLDGLKDDARHVFVVGDVGDIALVTRLLQTHQPRAILHFAAESHVDRSIAGAGDFIQSNICGTHGLLEAARTYWAGLTGPARDDFRFLHVSTDEVYGSLSPDAPAFTESSPFQPNNPYSASKAASDHLVRACGKTHGLPVLTTHCSNNFGPRQFPEKLIPLMIQNALAGLPLPVYGDGLHVRDWLYVTDHCAGLRKVLDRGRPGETYNLGGNSERTNLDVVLAVCKLLDQLRPRADGAAYKTQIAMVADRPGHDRRYAIDTTRAQRELGWRPFETFASGLEKTVRWYLDNPQWVADIVSGACREGDPAP